MRITPEQNRGYCKVWYWRRRANQECVTCGKPNPDGKTRCPPCYAKSLAVKAKFNRKLYAERKTKGLCVACSRPTKGTARCRGCARKINAYQRAQNPFEVEETNVPRCRCGLALPCESCLPNIYYYAAKRVAL